MKIVVTEMPKDPTDCMFSKYELKFGHICSLYTKDSHGKRRSCICNPKHCDRLVIFEDMFNERTDDIIC